MKKTFKTFAAATAAIMISAFACKADEVSTTTSTTHSAGTISEFGGDTISIRSETSSEPVRYSYSKSTTYVDESGAPVSMSIVKSGLPVTVYYVKEGDRMVANKVVVRKTKTTTSGDSGMIEKKSSSTTTTETH